MLNALESYRLADRPWLMLCLACVGAVFLWTSVEAGDAVDERHTLTMSAQQFDQWIADMRVLRLPTEETTKAAADALIARLQAGIWVPDETIQDIMHGHLRLDNTQSGDAEERDVETYARTFKLMESVESLLYKRPTMSAWLHHKRGEVLARIHLRQQAAEDFEKARDLWHQLHLTIDLHRIVNLVRLGWTYHVLGDKAAADLTFLEAQSYPFYKVYDAATRQRIRDWSTSATRGLIEVRRRDISALRNIRIVPAIQPAVQEQYDQALREAMGEPPDIDMDRTVN